jgi:predicted TIM-barrel fold metal-dependent hydrolase
LVVVKSNYGPDGEKVPMRWERGVFVPEGSTPTVERAATPRSKFFWPILECAEKLGVPIYLHPTQPPRTVIEASYGGFSPFVTDMLAGAGWGWHIETGLHVIRLILGGVFDRYPNLQVVIGHMGEGLPFMFQRLDVMPMAMTKLHRPVSAYLRDNVHYTFSTPSAASISLLDLLLELGGVDRIMFSAHPRRDDPYRSVNRLTRQF